MSAPATAATLRSAMPSHHSLALLVAVVLALLCIYSLHADAAEGAHGRTRKPVSKDAPAVCSVASRVQEGKALTDAERVPTLLFWDTEGVNYEMFGMWFGPKSFYECPVECHIEHSRDKHELARSEGVVFWATPLDKGVDLDKKCPNQIWFSASTEAFDIKILDKTPPQGLMADGRKSPIDMEISWRRSLGKDKVSWLNNFDWNSGHQLEQVWSAPERGPLEPATRTREGRDDGQAAVAAFISNCGAASPRLELLTLLQKYVPVDSFGRCAHNKDIPDSWNQGESDVSRGLLTQKNRILANRYKFLLAFENQETQDYVTGQAAVHTLLVL